MKFLNYFLVLLSTGVVSVYSQESSLTPGSNAFLEKPHIDNPFSLETLEKKAEHLRNDLKDEALLLESKSSAPDSGFTTNLFNKVQLGALVVVSNNEGFAIGFIGKLRDRIFFITNVHVLGMMKEARFTTMDGVAVPVGSKVFVSKRRDLVIIPIKWSGPVLEISPSLSSDGVTIGQNITVVSKLGRKQVINRIKGDIRGIGPDQLEVSAKFWPGDSGCPILHDKLGSVVGIVSHVRRGNLNVNRSSEDSELENTRWFGYRLDGEMEWEQTSFNELHTQADIYNRFEGRFASMWAITRRLVFDSKIFPNMYVHESLIGLYKPLIKDFDWNQGFSFPRNQELLRSFLSAMISEAEKDMKETEESLWVGFYRQLFEEMKEDHEALKESIRFFSDLRL